MHSDAFTRQPFRDLPMTVEAERHHQIGIMRFPNYVMFLKQAIQASAWDSSCFKPSPCYLSERFQARITAEEAECTSPKAILPLRFPARCANWKRVVQLAPPLNER